MWHLRWPVLATPWSIGCIVDEARRCADHSPARRLYIASGTQSGRGLAGGGAAGPWSSLGENQCPVSDGRWWRSQRRDLLGGIVLETTNGAVSSGQAAEALNAVQPECCARSTGVVPRLALPRVSAKIVLKLNSTVAQQVSVSGISTSSELSLLPEISNQMSGGRPLPALPPLGLPPLKGRRMAVGGSWMCLN